jgi:hypothetical protein
MNRITISPSVNIIVNTACNKILLKIQLLSAILYTPLL